MYIETKIKNDLSYRHGSKGRRPRSDSSPPHHRLW